MVTFLAGREVSPCNEIGDFIRRTGKKLQSGLPAAKSDGRNVDDPGIHAYGERWRMRGNQYDVTVRWPWAGPCDSTTSGGKVHADNPCAADNTPVAAVGDEVNGRAIDRDTGSVSEYRWPPLSDKMRNELAPDRAPRFDRCGYLPRRVIIIPPAQREVLGLHWQTASVENEERPVRATDDHPRKRLAFIGTHQFDQTADRRRLGISGIHSIGTHAPHNTKCTLVGARTVRGNLTRASRLRRRSHRRRQDHRDARTRTCSQRRRSGSRWCSAIGCC